MGDGFFNAHRKALWKAIVYIQNHLDSTLSLEQIAGVSGYSAYHFHRLFKQFTGESVKAYVRRLRLEASAFRIRVGRSQIIDVALDSGYFTHETFTRAFRQRFGENPSQYQKTRPRDRSDRWIESVQKVYFSGRSCIFKRHNGPYYTSGMPEGDNSLWRQLIGYLQGSWHSLTTLELFGISRDDPSITNPEKVRYDACIGVGRDFSKSRMTCEIPKGSYAKAIHRGPFKELTRSYHYLIYEWSALYCQQINYRVAPFEQFLMGEAIGDIRTESIAIYIPLIQS